MGEGERKFEHTRFDTRSHEIIRRPFVIHPSFDELCTGRTKGQIEIEKRTHRKLTEILCITKIFERHTFSSTVEEVDEEL